MSNPGRTRRVPEMIQDNEKEFIVRYHMLVTYEATVFAKSRTEAFMTASLQLARGESPNAEIVDSGRLTVLNVRFVDEDDA